MNQLHLYIGSKEVEFSASPDILYTYQQDDLTNPTAVKNSFSKTITIDGTPANNQLFGEYWNVERLQGSGGNGEGVYYNASKKVPFTLYIDHDIYETGYAKLDSIDTKGKSVAYNISLFGGLGDFFYNLSINDDGNQLRLSDLKFMEGSNSDDEFNFTANIATVERAWGVLRGKYNPQTYPMWTYINFMPAYNGFPEDFDTDKVVINTDGTTLLKTSGSYRTKDGFVLGTLPEKMDEWEIRDLRSYLQRPVIRMKSIVEACCKPENNGGYNVVLDPDFFNENNSYWEKTWLTLPMVQNLEYTNTEQILEGATLVSNTTTGSTGGLMYQDLTFSLGEFSQSIPSSIRISGRISIDTGNYVNTSYAWFWNYNGDSYHTGWWCLGSLFCQAVAFNGDTVVGASQAYNLTTPIRHNGKLYFGHNGRYSSGHKFNPYMDKDIYDVLGTFQNGVFTEENGSAARTFNFYINNLQSNVTAIKMVYFWGATDDKLNKHSAASTYDRTYSDGWVEMSCSNSPILLSEHTITNLDSNIQAVIGGSLGRTGTNITKSILLNSDKSPCDYLLSYTKMFGLVYVKDPESNTIYIETRKTFYNRGEVVNLNDMIDRSKSVTITPIAFDTKWYQFKQDCDATQFYNNYFAKNGVEYGSKILNTGYEFNAEKKQLLEDNAIKSGIEGLEKSKYFTAYSNDNVIRPWFGYGLVYNLYNGDATYSVTASTTNCGDIYGINEEDGMKYYDLFPKVQFHDADNKGTDGRDCLVFYSGVKNIVNNRSVALSYYLTDDTPAQTQLNEGTPCWLFTSKEYVNGVRIAYKLTSIPVFERYLTNQSSGKVIRSLDFGSAQELFVPTYSLTDDVNIYYNFWKTYLEDLYDANTKVLKCFVKIEGKPSTDWLRRFYWFDNSIWRISRITDWNPSSYDTTQVEFVKVQDIADYTSITQVKGASVSLTSDKYVVNSDGDSATLTITKEGGSPQRRVRLISDNTGMTVTEVGEDEYVATFSQNNTDTDRNFYVTAIDEDGNTSRIYIRQTYDGSTTLSATPSTLIVGADGDTYDVNFEWFNQEEYYIDTFEVFGDITADADVDTYQEDNVAVLTVSANTGTSLISGFVMWSNDNYNTNTYIDQLPASIAFNENGSNYTLNFAYTEDVTFLNIPYWLSVTQNSTKSFTLTADPNLYEQAREGEVVVTDGHSEASFTVSQPAGGISYSVTSITPTNIYYASSGETGRSNGKYITINLDTPWNITNVGSHIGLSQTEGEAGLMVVLVWITDAATIGGRTEQFTINYGDGFTANTVVNVITQGSGSASFSVSPTTANVANTGGTVDITVNYHNRNGYDVVPQPSSTACTCTPISWTGETGTTTATIAANNTADTRTFTISFSGATTALTGTTTITQAAAAKSVSLSDRALFLDGGWVVGQEITVIATTPWSAVTSDNWIVATPTTGNTSTTTMTIGAGRNKTGSIRRGTVNFYDASDPTNLLATLTVNQASQTTLLTVSPSSYNFASSGGSAILSVNADLITEWTTTIPSAFWLSVSPISGTGSGSITVSATANNNINARYASFEVTDGVRTVTVTISQDGVSSAPYAIVSNDDMYFDADEDHTRLDAVTSNVSWTATTSDSWIFIDNPSGTGGTSSIGISVAENTSRYTRLGVVYIRNRANSNILTSISVTQYGTDPSPRPEPVDPVL